MFNTPCPIWRQIKLTKTISPVLWPENSAEKYLWWLILEQYWKRLTNYHDNLRFGWDMWDVYAGCVKWVLSMEGMDITIQTLTGTVFDLRVSPFESVLSIKSKLERLEGIPPCQQVRHASIRKHLMPFIG